MQKPPGEYDRSLFSPHEPYLHANFRAHVGDPEPSVRELLRDPVVCALMASDGVSQLDLEHLIERARDRIGLGAYSLYVILEARLLLECA